jgi:type IV secretion system protein VirB10
VREINSDLPGVITARTTRDIYDSTSVSRLVIPRGTTVIGDYSSDVRGGQARLLFGFTRLVFPDGSSFDLNGFGGSDAQGRSGVEATVDNHYFRLFGTSLLIGLLADRVVRRDVVPQGGNGSGGGLTATGQILTDSARAILERNRESKPTLTIKAGTRVLIEVRRDMIFPTAYRG